jgi:uncharacterized protein (TIGR02118 family)
MHRVTIQYARPEAPDAFDAHYFDRHLPLVAPLPGLRALRWSRPRLLGKGDEVYLVAELEFDDAATLKAALSSPQMKVVGDDAAALGATTTVFTGEVVEVAV